MLVEEIVLSSDSPHTPADQPAVDLISTAALVQSSRLRFSRAVFELFNRRHLSVNLEHTFRSNRKYNLDIGILDPLPRRSVKISWPYVSLFVVLAASAVYTALNEYTRDTYLWPAFLALSAGLSLLLAVYDSHDRLVFYSRNGRIPLVILFNRNPDRRTFKAFTNQLAHYIHQVSNTPLHRDAVLNVELMEHRRLMEEGVISAKRYELAKLRILRRHC